MLEVLSLTFFGFQVLHITRRETINGIDDERRGRRGVSAVSAYIETSHAISAAPRLRGNPSISALISVTISVP